MCIVCLLCFLFSLWNKLTHDRNAIYLKQISIVEEEVVARVLFSADKSQWKHFLVLCVGGFPSTDSWR